jgi:hypothetical protein
MPINPAFDTFPAEGAIIGKLVVSFGELELLCGLLAGTALKNQDMALRAIYRGRSTRGRIDLADVLMRDAFVSIGLKDDYEEMLVAVLHSLSIRNHYAHCHWAPGQDGLFFAKLEDSAKRETGFDADQKHVGLILLQEQEAYFDYARSMLLFLQAEFQIKSGNTKHWSAPRPPKRSPPNLHNPASLHIPHWLPEDAKRRHLGQALESEGDGPQPERLPSVLKLTREGWAAKDAKDAREAASKLQGPEESSK